MHGRSPAVDAARDAAHQPMSPRLRALDIGTVLLRTFWWTTLAATIGLAGSAFVMLPGRWLPWTVELLVVTVVESVVFWAGIIAVYLTSVQLGLRIRIIGVVCG